MKLVVRLLIGLLALLVLAGIGAVLFIDSLAEKTVEHGGTYAFGVPTELDRASIGLFSGRFSLHGLEVANPPGFAEPSLFTLRSVELELPLRALREERVTIPSLVLDGISIDLERNARGTNYGALLDNLQRLESGTAPPPEDPQSSGGSKLFVLQELLIRDVHASIRLLPEGGELTRLSLSIPEIRVRDLNSQMTLAQICALVVRTVVQAAVQQGGGTLPDELLADLRERLQGLEGAARERLDQELQKTAGKLGPEAEQVLRGAGEKLDELLKKDKKK